MKESQIREHISKGWVRAIITFEVVGKPAKHVEDALTRYLDNIKKDERIVILKEDREAAMEHEDGMFSTFCEAETLVQDLETFTWLCINFSPASIEILEPDMMEMDARNLTNWLNDLLAKVHEIGMSHRTNIGSVEHLTVAMNQLIQNTIILSLKSGPKTEGELEQDTGVYAAQLEPFLKHLIENAQIMQSGEKYILAPQGALPIKTHKVKQK
jgi:hypothetical protein